MSKLLAVVALVVALNVPRPAEELGCAKVAKLPAIDGKADDDAWKSAKELVAKIDETDEENPKKKISLKAVHDGDSIAILMVWEDPDRSDSQAPFVWKDSAYEADEEKVEDRCSIGFEMEGKFDSDMKAGIESKWDVWEWCAARANNGYGFDRTHIYSKTPPPPPIKARRLTARDGSLINFWHPMDEGTPCYKTVPMPESKGAPVVQQFVPQTPTGSSADVQAKGDWANGKWTVEFKRKLNTGHKDDTVLAAGKSLGIAVATFDKAEKGDHMVSKVITLKIQ
jgi:hypothetical protein